MTYGIKILDKNGNLWMDSTLVTWNLIETFVVDAAADVTKTYSGYSGLEFLVVQIPLEVPKVNDYTYEKNISVSDTTVHIYGGNQKAQIVVMAR